MARANWGTEELVARRLRFHSSPQLKAMLERQREANGNPNSGPIFANGAGKAFDLDSLYRARCENPSAG